jgi:hypothetical protein
LIVQIAPYNVIPCNRDAASIIKLVLRPRSLWIDNTSATQRRDFYGNRNNQTGAVAGGGVNFSDKNILPIFPSYKAGDEITLTKLHKPLCQQSSITANDSNRIFDGVDIFTGATSSFSSSASTMSNDYKSSSANQSISALPLFSYISGISASNFNIVINSNGAGGTNNDVYVEIFKKMLTSLGKFNHFLNAAGTVRSKIDSSNLIKDRGRLFGRYLLSSVEYQDANLENRTRPKDSGCLPLVVASPSTFPTPIQRNLGGVNITL